MLLVFLISMNLLIEMGDRIDIALANPTTLTTAEYDYIKSGLSQAQCNDGGLQCAKVNAVVYLDVLTLEYLREFNTTGVSDLYRKAIVMKVFSDEIFDTIKK